LRENAHLSPYQYVWRHYAGAFGFVICCAQLFSRKGFVYVNTPIITGSDAEGAGEMFKVTALPFDGTPRTEDGKSKLKISLERNEFNGFWTIRRETFTMALGQIYTFGPTFRAENSNTSRHLAEFWMIEPEVAFNDLNDNMDLAEDFIQYVIKYTLDKCQDDLKFLETRLLDEEIKTTGGKKRNAFIGKIKLCA
jgi:asparaginyl-tRNA synthetase